MTEATMKSEIVPADSKLEACPFCGGVGPYVTREITPWGRTIWTVVCAGCAATGPWSRASNNDACRQWNRRVSRAREHDEARALAGIIRRTWRDRLSTDKRGLDITEPARRMLRERVARLRSLRDILGG